MQETEARFENRVVRTMICISPWSSWPLQVKLFCPEAAEAWEAAASRGLQLPAGFSLTKEYEGVDGKRQIPDPQRTGPIDVKDGESTS